MSEATKKRVLIVDDEPLLVRSLSRVLSARYEIHTCVDGVRGLQILASPGGFAVVVSDLRMPGMDGVEFLRRARVVSPSTAQILLTGTLGYEDFIAGERPFLSCALEKPCPNERLASAIEDAARTIGA